MEKLTGGMVHCKQISVNELPTDLDKLPTDQKMELVTVPPFRRHNDHDGRTTKFINKYGVNCLLVVIIGVLALVMGTIVIIMWSQSLSTDLCQLGRNRIDQNVIKELRQNLIAEMEKRDSVLHKILVGQQMSTKSPRKRNKPTNKKRKTKVNRKKVKEPCGGIVLVPDQIEVSYTNSGNNEEKCVWVILTRGLDKVSYNFTTHSSQDSQFLDTLSSLSVHTLDRDNSTVSGPIAIQVENLNTELTIQNSFGIIISTSKKGQGFRLQLRCPGYCGTFGLNPSALLLPPVRRQGLNGSVECEEYENNERRLIVLKPVFGLKAQISVTSVAMEMNNDFLSILKFSKRDNSAFTPFQTYTGIQDKPRHATFTGEEGQPMLIYFYSDSTVRDKGFSFFYNYVE